jgi:hypothetical protein
MIASPPVQPKTEDHTMKDDIISALTQEVKQEVVENYLYERRLMEEQIAYVKELAEETRQLQDTAYRRFARIYELLGEEEFVDQFVQVLGLNSVPFETRFQEDPDFRKGLKFIKVWGLTHKAKFKRLLSEAYRRLFRWNAVYAEGYENFEAECRAANHNLKRFQEGFDLLTILNFLKDMDVDFIEKKHWLSDNFTPEEMTAVEKSLTFKAIRIERFDLVPPPNLPEPKGIQGELDDLADCVFGECAVRIKSYVR